MPVATKLGRVVTYHERLLLIKSHDALITVVLKHHVTN